MERLETLKKEHEASLVTLALEGGAARYRIVGSDTFENFASYYRSFVLKAAPIPEQKQMVQKFIRKVEVSTESVRIHFIEDQDHYSRELASKEAGSPPFRGKSEILRDGCSYTLTNGALEETRTLKPFGTGS